MGTILSDLGLESPDIGMAVTGHITSSGPDGFRCTVRDPGTGRTRDALLPRTDAYDLPEGAAPPQLKPGDTVIALVTGTSEGAPSAEPRLMLSVTAPRLVERILAGFVPELVTGEVVVKGIARVAGSKTKIVIAPTTKGVDARGACIGRGANRLRGAESRLNQAYGRERLEIIEYSSDRRTFLIHAMNPVQVTDVLVERNDAIVWVEEHQLSGGIGAGGLNAQLAGQLTGLFVVVVKAGTDRSRAMERLAAEKTAAKAG